MRACGYERRQTPPPRLASGAGGAHGRSGLDAFRARHRRPAREQRAPGDIGQRAVRTDADGNAGGLDRCRADDVRIPMATVRRGREQLRGHPRRYGAHVRAGHGRHRRPGPHSRHCLQLRRLGRPALVELLRRRLPADQHRAARPLRHRPRRRDAHRYHGNVDRYRADRLRVPVAAVRHKRLELREHRRSDGHLLPPRLRGRGQSHPDAGDGVQRARERGQANVELGHRPHWG